MKKISIVTPCYNEEENAEKVYTAVKDVFNQLPEYEYEHLFIDNSSKDKTVEILKKIATQDKNVKIIVNSRNFGWVRSPLHGLYEASGDAVVLLVADLQDPPEMIIDFVREWEKGYKTVIGIKASSEESKLMFSIRQLYYKFINKISEIELINKFTGFGLYDRQIIDIMKEINDPFPYFRGLVAEIGFDIARIEYTQPQRHKGISSSNFYRLYEMAMLGITNHSKIPLRLATMFGFVMSAISLLIGFFYFCAKLIFWNKFPLGTAPIVISLYLLSSVQLFFIGIIGEYIGSIHTQTQKRPLVFEKERINF